MKNAAQVWGIRSEHYFAVCCRFYPRPIRWRHTLFVHFKQTNKQTWWLRSAWAHEVPSVYRPDTQSTTEPFAQTISAVWWWTPPPLTPAEGSCMARENSHDSPCQQKDKRERQSFELSITQCCSPLSKIVLDSLGELSTRFKGYFCVFRYSEFHSKADLQANTGKCQTVLGSNPAVAAALSPWTRLFTPIVPKEKPSH